MYKNIWWWNLICSFYIYRILYSSLENFHLEFLFFNDSIFMTIKDLYSLQNVHLVLHLKLMSRIDIFFLKNKMVVFITLITPRNYNKICTRLVFHSLNRWLFTVAHIVHWQLMKWRATLEFAAQSACKSVWKLFSPCMGNFTLYLWHWEEEEGI